MSSIALRRARWAGAFLLAAAVAAVGTNQATVPIGAEAAQAVIRAVPLVLTAIEIGWAVTSRTQDERRHGA